MRRLLFIATVILVTAGSISGGRRERPLLPARRQMGISGELPFLNF
jgi:hypothetical protein